MRPGDSAWSISRRFCREKTCWPAIARHNSVAPAALPRAGQRLRIPVHLLSRQPISATAAVVTGEAWVRRRGSQERRLADNDLLQIDDRVRTAAGTVTVRFGDRSELVVGPESEILFDMLGAFGDGGMVDTQVRALRGRLEPRVTPRSGGSSFRIVTPTGTAVVRGTEFRIRAEDASFAELTRGALTFDGADSSTPLAAGFGLVAAAGRAPPPPEALLAAAVLATGATARSIPFEVRWLPVTGARGYRVLLFRPGAEAVLVSVHDTPTEAIRLSPIPGPYRVVVRAISASGLEGLDASTALTAIQGPPVPMPSSDGQGAAWPAIEGASDYQVELARDDTFSASILKLQVGVPSFSTELQPGRTWVRVRGVTLLGATEFSVPIVLDRAPAAPVLSTNPRSWNSDSWRLEWSTVPGARYRLQYAPDDSFGDGLREVVTELRSWSLSCPHARCSVRVRAEYPVPPSAAVGGTGESAPGDGASDNATRGHRTTSDGTAAVVVGPWSATGQIGGGGFLRMLEPRG